MVEKTLNNTTPYGKIRASHEGSLHSSTLIKYLNAVVRHTTAFFDDLAIFQSKTYSNCIPSDENVLNTNGELSERAFNLAKRARNLTDVFQYVGVHWQTYGCVTAA